MSLGLHQGQLMFTPSRLLHRLERGESCPGLPMLRQLALVEVYEMSVTEGMLRTVSKCKVCGKVDKFEIPVSGLEARAKGIEVHEAFPDLPETRIRQLTEHLCPGCQEA